MPPATPSPSAALLATEGPYLIYAKYLDGKLVITLSDADGRGQSVISLPNGAWTVSLEATTSLDGRWLAYYTGSAGQCFAEKQTGPFDLALNLMDLSSGRTRLLTHLLSANFPDNFRAAADLLAARGLTPEQGADPLILHDALACGIGSLAWSPDGRYLAFAGQMDGLSSDVYVFDIQAETIRRLTDGIEQIQSIAWSPDGKWILHGSANFAGEGAEIHYHAAAVDGSIAKTLPSSVEHIREQIAPSSFLVSDGREGIGSYNLRRIDIESGVVTTLWETAFRSTAIDREHHLLAIAGYEALRQDTHPALFFVDLNSGDKRKIRDEISGVRFIGGQKKRFIATEDDTFKTFFVTLDGLMAETDIAVSAETTSSPSFQYIAVPDRYLHIYTTEAAFVREIKPRTAGDSVDSVIWRPDSSGLFFVMGSDLYAADLLEGEAYRVDGDLPKSGRLNYTWATGW